MVKTLSDLSSRYKRRCRANARTRFDDAAAQDPYEAWGRSSAQTTLPVAVGRQPHAASRPTIISP